MLPWSAFGLEVSPKNPVPPYTLVRVQVDQGERCWVLKQDFSPVDLEYTKSGFCFVGPPGRYVILAMTPDGQNQAVVEIGGSGPTPPGPLPPGPTPPTPNDKYGLVAISSVSRSKIGNDGRQHIGAIAANFSAAAAAIRAGALRDRTTAMASLQAANKITLVDGSLAWASWKAWSNDVGFAFDRLNRAGSLPTVTEYAEAFEDVSRGLMAGVW